jgi:hypothetical protein
VEIGGSVVWQPSLWGFAEEPALDARFAALVRHRLDATTWADHAPGWVRGTDAVLDELLTARDAADVELVETMRAALSERYGMELHVTATELLASGDRTIAWRQDASGARYTNPVVATVSFGARRTVRMRPRGVKGGTTNFTCASGDLFVMGGGAQHTWDHCVPRNRRARGPHVRVTFAAR